MKNIVQVLFFLLSAALVRSQYDECIVALNSLQNPVEPKPGPPGPPGQDCSPDPDELKWNVIEGIKEERRYAEACFGGVYITSASHRVCLIKTPDTFAKSRQYCKDLGPNWDLATSSVRDNNIRIEIGKNLVKANGANRAWVGLTDQTIEGKWEYIDGVAAPAKSMEPWGTGEPNDAGNNEDCAQMGNGGDFTFNDLRCNHNEPNALCEYKK